MTAPSPSGRSPSGPPPSGRSASAPARSVHTRERLLDAAEELLARRGLDGVSLREINRHAGQANASAVQYHFGGRDELVAAVLRRHRAVIDVRHHELLDAIAPTHRTDLVLLTDALVRPLAERLDTVSGRRFLVIQAEEVHRSTPASLGLLDLTQESGFDRWRLAVEPALEPATVAVHVRFLALQLAYAELANWIRREPGALDGDTVDLDTVHLDTTWTDAARDRTTSLVLAVLAAPVRPGPGPAPVAPRSLDRATPISPPLGRTER